MRPLLSSVLMLGALLLVLSACSQPAQSDLTATDAAPIGAPPTIAPIATQVAPPAYPALATDIAAALATRAAASPAYPLVVVDCAGGSSQADLAALVLARRRAAGLYPGAQCRDGECCRNRGVVSLSHLWGLFSGGRPMS